MSTHSDYDKIRRNFEDKVAGLKIVIQDNLIRENNYQKRAASGYTCMHVLDKMLVNYIQMCNYAEELDYNYGHDQAGREE